MNKCTKLKIKQNGMMKEESGNFPHLLLNKKRFSFPN
jgi:hypothetical protein